MNGVLRPNTGYKFCSPLRRTYFVEPTTKVTQLFESQYLGPRTPTVC
jgi:hypothetical protein